MQIPSWAMVVAVIVVVMAVAAVIERWRLRRLERASAQAGFKLHRPFRPGEQPPMAILAELLNVTRRPARQWGAGMTGVLGGQQVVIAEFLTSGSTLNSPDVWRTMLVWRQPATSPTEPETGGPPVDQRSEAFVRQGDWVAWRINGNLTEANLSALLAGFPEARNRCMSQI